MQYTILCVGKIKEKFYTDAVNEYKKRLSRYAKVDIIEVSDEKTPEHASDLQQEQIRQKEAERLLSKIKDSMYVIALDLKGKKFDSEGFAKHLSMCMNQGKSHIVYSRQAGQEIEALEHKANAGIARMGQFIICITGNILTFEDILPRCRAVKTAQDIHQRRLPAS